MTGKQARRQRVALLTAAATLGLALVGFAGTSFRLEVGPAVAGGTNFKLKGAVFVVRALVCDDLSTVRIRGTAEGIVNGTRQTLPLKLIQVNTPGVYAVTQEWPMAGHWIVHLSGSCQSPKADASTIVPMRTSAFVRDKVQVLREPATKAQLDAVLTALVRAEP